MHFLQTLFGVVIAALLAILGTRNWIDVPLALWGDLVVSIKLPFLLLVVFLLSFLPTWLIFRARLWAVKRKLEPYERQRASAAPPLEPQPAVEPDPAT